MREKAEEIMEGFTYELKIPKERVAVLIGKSGLVKKQLEEQTKTSISVDSKEGDVFIKGKDALSLFALREVVKAVGRGFNPETAQLLLRQDYTLEIIELSDFVKSKEQMLRIKGRVIGTEGKSRRVIEDLSECDVCVYGKTVSIIGRIEKMALARKSVEMLLSGSTHATVYKWLEKERARIKKDAFTPL